MDQKGDDAIGKHMADQIRAIELVSQLGREFLGLIQELPPEQNEFLSRRMQLARQAASPTFVRNISTHRTRLDYSGLPAKLGSIKGLKRMFRAWREKRRERRDMRNLGIRLVEVHIVTPAEARDITSDLVFLQKRRYRMTTLFELLCFIDSNPSIVGHNDMLITLEDEAPGEGSKHHIETFAHCIRRSSKGDLIYSYITPQRIQSLPEDGTRPVFHYVVMDAEDENDAESGDPEAPSDS